MDVASFVPGPAPGSRAIRHFKRVARPDLDPAGFVEQLRTFIKLGGHDMVIPTDDQALMALADHYQELDGLVWVACPPPEITRRILNKASTLEVAERCGFRIPKTRMVTSSAQLRKVASEFSFPAVLKPASKETSIEVFKSLTLNDADQVAENFPSSYEFKPAMLLQEYCPGNGVGIELLLHHGECLAAFQHRRMQEVPYTGGVSVTAIAEQADPGLVEKSVALLRALRWEGPAMIELKFNASDGSVVFMEVNGRYWGTISLAVSAGVDFPLYHWQLLHGEVPAVPAKYAVGTKWRWTAGHVWRLHGLMLAARRSKSARKELLRSLSGLRGLLDRSMRNALFSPVDPVPEIVDTFHLLKFLVKCDIRDLFHRLRRYR